MGRYVSIYSLMRDGRDLADGLREARTHLNNGWADVLSKLVDPYLQFVTSENAACEFTGLRLMDVWRYFRHTWTNQYTSVPGRTMVFLVRDRAAANHPVMGIGALSSPIMQIRERDSWIGWHPETFLERVRTAPTRELARWLVDTLDAAIDEIYVADLIEDGIISTRDLKTPSVAVIERLLKESAEARKKHHRFARSRDHKQKRSSLPGDEYWIAKARTHLFRSKRALALSTYLRARAVIDEAFGGKPTAEKLGALAKTGYGSDAIRRVLKKAKADRVGIAVADISVCGAVQPYNALLGGKLTAMMAASPEVVQQYRRRYARAESEIASSMAGGPSCARRSSCSSARRRSTASARASTTGSRSRRSASGATPPTSSATKSWGVRRRSARRSTPRRPSRACRSRAAVRRAAREQHLRRGREPQAAQGATGARPAEPAVGDAPPPPPSARRLRGEPHQEPRRLPHRRRQTARVRRSRQRGRGVRRRRSARGGASGGYETGSLR
jgi:hypothetical protein